MDFKLTTPRPLSDPKSTALHPVAEVRVWSVTLQSNFADSPAVVSPGVPADKKAGTPEILAGTIVTPAQSTKSQAIHFVVEAGGEQAGIVDHAPPQALVDAFEAYAQSYLAAHFATDFAAADRAAEAAKAMAETNAKVEADAKAQAEHDAKIEAAKVADAQVAAKALELSVMQASLDALTKEHAEKLAAVAAVAAIPVPA